jgi:hypothetical protein
VEQLCSRVLVIFGKKDVARSRNEILLGRKTLLPLV